MVCRDDVGAPSLGCKVSDFIYGNVEVLGSDVIRILKYFRQREVQIAVMCYHNAYELQRCIDCNCPDILFYDMEREDASMRSTVMNAKRANPKLISIIRDTIYRKAGVWHST